MRFRRSAFAAGSEKSHSVSSGVSMGPGQMALLRTPLGPNCTASDLVSAITAPFEAVETGHTGVLGYQRGELLCLHNFTDQPVDLGPVELGPYGYAWLPVEV